MKSRTLILDELVESVPRTPTDEGVLAKAAGIAVGAAAVKSLLGKKPPKSGRGTKPQSTAEFARALIGAKNQKHQVAAVVGLLNIAANVLLNIPDLRELGFKVRKVVMSEKFKEFTE